MKPFIRQLLSSQETHKGESWRKGYQQGVKESRSQVVELIEGMKIKPETDIKPWMDYPNGWNKALSDLLDKLK